MLGFSPLAGAALADDFAADAGGGVSVSVTGVAATGAVGSVTTTADANTSVTGVATTGAVGSVSVSVSGVGVTIVLSTDAIIAYLGAVAVRALGDISPSQDPAYAEIAPEQTPVYSGVNPAPGSTWTRIVA